MPENLPGSDNVGLEP